MKTSGLPWQVPHFVKEAPYEVASGDVAGYGVEVDHGAFGAFYQGTPGPAKQDLLWADLQTNIDINVPGRLGSGRSGTYRGKYLKGIGRTNLAANWTSREELYHGSGHMFPSAAGREFLVSQYLAERDLCHTIIPCEGVLIRELAEELRGVYRRTFADRTLYDKAIDDHAQAITVKPAEFIRMSHINWLLDHKLHLGESTYLVFLLEQLSGGLAAGEAVNSAELDIESITAQLSTLVHRLWNYFDEFFAHGISWGSLHNNFSLDGRFLDLEVPKITGVPLIGLAYHGDFDFSRTDEIEGLNFGVEVFEALKQVNLFMHALASKLNFFAKHLTRSSIEREFTEEFAAAVSERCLGPDGLFAQDRLEANWLDMAERRLGCGREALRPYARFGYERFFAAEPVRLKIKLRRYCDSLAQTEPSYQPVVWIPAELDCIQPPSQEALAWNRHLTAIDQTTKLEDYIYLLNQRP